MNIKSYTLQIPGHIEVTFLNFGGILQSLRTPDKNGKLTDVVLGFDDPEDYRRRSHPYLGALIGRYANRIKDGHYELDERITNLVQNEGTNSLHGGAVGLDKKFWEVHPNTDQYSYSLKLISPDGDQGHPGELQVEVTYRVTQDQEFIIDYCARTSAPTALNLTNHSYFNLSGGETSILNHELWLDAALLTEVEEDLIPTGRLLPVKGAMDFQTPKTVGRDIFSLKRGYDHNYVLNKERSSSAKARLTCASTGIVLEVFTTEPGMQVYSGHYLDGSLVGKGNRRYRKFHGICLETQHFPDSPHHRNFPTTILRPGDTFKSRTTFKLSSCP
jgi:aldose 1-epimerase